MFEVSNLQRLEILLPGILPSEGHTIITAHAPEQMAAALRRHPSVLAPLAQAVGRTPRLLEVLVRKARMIERRPDDPHKSDELEAFSTVVAKTTEKVKDFYPQAVWEQIFSAGFRSAVARLLSWALERRLVGETDVPQQHHRGPISTFGILNLVPVHKGSYRIEQPLVMLHALVELLRFDIPSELLYHNGGL
jgi:hypothetical protein